MDTKDIKQLDNIIKELGRKKLGYCIHSTRSFVSAHPYMMYDDELENIERDYNLMLEYMKRGFNDPQRKDIYSKLLARLYNFVSNLRIAYMAQNISFYTEATRKSVNQSFSEERIKTALETFVTDVAMLSLEPEPARTEKSKEIYRRHNDFIQALFGYIIVSRQWTDNERDFFEGILLSPATDIIDAQLITSAIMLATMNNMDINKFHVLINVYKKTTDSKLRQRALVGWVFALSAGPRLHPQMREMVASVLEGNGVANEIADLQKQIIFCMNAEQDNNTIQRDIMPELMKNNNLNITRFGITEKEDDPMNDIFDPGASDRAMEKMEESFQKMMNMQKAGSDIYFGGFSQMKRFPFFYHAANWFCPFYLEHPEISSTVDKLKDTPLLTNILNNGPFCDSDKYSFTLAVASVISHIPANMREMFNTKEALGQTVSDEDQRQPAYIRRMILQDMYRFFRLFHQRGQLVNPFDKSNSIFVADDLFNGTEIQKVLPDLCYFMLKHKNKNALEHLLPKYNDTNDSKCMLIHGIYELNYCGNPKFAAEYLEKSLELQPDNRRAKSMLARACFEAENYDDAAKWYEVLYNENPQSQANALNYCVALSKAERYSEATNLLFKLDIEYPDSIPVTRVLAWNLMGLDKLQQAEKAYRRILKSNDTENGDWLNAGYCQWLLGNISEAVEMFKKFMSCQSKDTSTTLYDELAKDRKFLISHGIDEIDILLMTDLIKE